MSDSGSGQPLDLVSFYSPHWQDYVLLDSGDGRKLERFGPYALLRPEPAATWKPALSHEVWAGADAILHLGGRTEGGRWEFCTSIERSWTMRYRHLTFRVGINKSRHIGVFPEHAVHWDWIGEQVATSKRVEQDSVRVLTLFCYTGLATLAAAAAGAEVTHVDASRRAVTIGRENQMLSRLADRPIRWMVDDALKFVRREARRGVRYEGIVMDPPRFGRGPKGEVWEFFESFPLLCEACHDVLSERPSFLLLTAYAKRASAPELCKAIEQMMSGFDGSIVAGELVTIERSAGRVIPHSISIRWSADR